MKIHISEKQKSVAVCAVGVFAACLLLTIIVWRFSSLITGVKEVVSVLSPVIWGLVFAYLLSPLQNWLERWISKLTDRKRKRPVLKRLCAVTLTILLFLAALTGFIAMLLPELIESLRGLFNNLPGYMKNAGIWAYEHLEGLKTSQPQLYNGIITGLQTVQAKLISFITEFEPKVESLVSSANLIGTITSSAYTFFNSVMNFLLGIIVAIYLLYSKERYLAQIKKLMYALFPERRVHAVLKIGSRVSHTFMHFLLGKGLLSLIIGVLCFIGLTIMKMPYAALISLVNAVTNVIPFFGPFIGAIPSGLLILLSDPSKVIPFIVFMLVLQQVEGNLLEPKILGDTLGLPTFWVVFAIFIGGGLFGFIGMVAFVPLFAALYTFIQEFLAARLSRKGLPYDTESYMTRKLVYAQHTQQEQKTEECPEAAPAVGGDADENNEPDDTENRKEDSTDESKHDV